MKNKILFFSYWYPNKYSKVFPVFVKKHAQSINIENDLIVLSVHIIKGSGLYKKQTEIVYDENNIETHQLYIESRLYKVLYILLPLHYFIVKKHIKNAILPKYKFDIIHSNILFPCAIVGYRLSRHFKCKHVITEHWSKINHFFKKNIYRLSGKTTLDRSDAITCVSDILQTTLKKHSTNKNILIVPNVIDQSDFYYDSSVSKNSTFTFIAAANWTVPKNPFYFLDALNKLKEDGKITAFNLYLIGNGHQLEDVKKRNYNFEIKYTGILNSQELALHLNQSHLFLHGSDYETFSTIIAEALMCGLPSVVSPVGIAAEVINTSNGFITNNTPEDWYGKILKCYHSSYDSKHISEQLKDRYDLKTVGYLFTRVYDKVLNKA